MKPIIWYLHALYNVCFYIFILYQIQHDNDDSIIYFFQEVSIFCLQIVNKLIFIFFCAYFSTAVVTATTTTHTTHTTSDNKSPWMTSLIYFLFKVCWQADSCFSEFFCVCFLILIFIYILVLFFFFFLSIIFFFCLKDNDKHHTK